MDKSEGKRALGRPKGRWEDNIKMDLYDSDGGIDWIDEAQVAGSYECGNEPLGSIKCRNFLSN